MAPIYQNPKINNFLDKIDSIFLRFEGIIWWGLAFGICLGVYLQPISGFDWFEGYLPQVINFSKDNLTNPVWLYFLITPIANLPGRLNFLVICLLNILLIYFASRISKSNRFAVLLSFPALWVLWFGQLDTIVLFGTVLGWLALEKKKNYLLGLAVMMMLVKPHIGGVLALIYLFWARDWRPFVTILIIYLLSNLVWGWDWSILWILQLYHKAVGPVFIPQKINISLFPYGLFFLLVIFLPMPRKEKIIVTQAATLLATPYSPAYSMLFLLTFPLPWWAYLLLTLPILLLGANGYFLTILMPISLLIFYLYPILKSKINKPRKFNPAPAE